MLEHGEPTTGARNERVAARNAYHWSLGLFLVELVFPVLAFLVAAHVTRSLHTPGVRPSGDYVSIQVAQFVRVLVLTRAICIPVLVPVHIGLAVNVYRIATAMRSAPWAWVLGLFLPYANLAVAVVFLASASTWLRVGGTHVRPGPAPTEEPPLRPPALLVEDALAAGKTDEEAVGDLVAQGVEERRARRVVANVRDGLREFGPRSRNA